MVSNFKVLVLRGNSLGWGCWSTETGYAEKLWISHPWNVQNQIGWSSDLLGLVEAVPAHARGLELRGLKSPFWSRPFYVSMILLVVMQTSDSVMNYTVYFLEQPTILMGAFSNHTKLILRLSSIYWWHKLWFGLTHTMWLHRETNRFAFQILLLVPGDRTLGTALQKLKMWFFSLSASSVTPRTYSY